MGNYYIGIDEMGQPYFTHATKKNKPKFLQKIDNYYKNGKALYLYTTKRYTQFYGP